MRKFLKQLKVSPYFLAGIFLFAYLESIRSRVGPGQLINWYVFTPEAAIFTFLEFILLIFILRFSFRIGYGKLVFPIQWFRASRSFLIGMGIFLIVVNLISIGVSLIFDTWDRNFSPEILLSNTVSKILAFIVYGGFYLTFLLFEEYKNHQQKLSNYELAVAESKFAQLKQQLNPHFLFNNLNILDQLIEESPKTASAFLQNFSELYRYALEKTTARLVDWEEELEFAKSYLWLIQEKYGNAYQLNLNLEHPKGKIPPLTLQLLIENAVIHNFGTKEKPVFIELYMGKNIRVSNNRIPFKHPSHRGGRGLQNLKEQIQMLSQESIVIYKTREKFTVTLPLIQE